MSAIQSTPNSIPFVISVSPSPQPAPKKHVEVKETLFDLKKYKWVLVTLVVLLVVLIVAWWFWGSKNNATNAVRIGGKAFRGGNGCAAAAWKA
jgi:hypothetical protein